MVPVERAKAARYSDAEARFGTESYIRTEAFTKLSKRSQKDYREALQKLADLPTKTAEKETGGTVRVGELPSSDCRRVP
jgi:hypothetical protein